MLSNSFRQARAAAAGVVLATVAGLAGLAAPPVRAQSASVTNVATIAAPDGINDADPGNNTGSATVTVTSAAAYSFCTAPGGSATSNATYSIVNGVQIYRYEPGAGADAVVPELALPTVGGDVNALMIDPARDRLLFHAGSSSTLWAYDADNGGWYAAATGVSGNFPRGGVAPDGTGYLIEGGASPAVWRITPSGAFGYTVANIGNLSYDFAPQGSNTSGDVAFDANGNGWLLVGRDLYLVDFATLTATRQTRPLIGGAVPTFDFAGVAFADDGTLYLANNAGGGGSSYYAYDPQTGELTQAAPTSAGGSRDLASCAFPTPAEPDLSVVKTLAEVDGVPYVAGATVQPGDVLTYAITISNAGTAVGTLYPNDVVETVPANTTYMATGNTFSAAATPGPGYTLGSAVNVPAGGTAVLNFVVQVDDPVPAGVTSIANAVTFPNDVIDCTAAGNDCEETTPLGPTTSVAKSSDPASGTAVGAGDTIAYTLTVTVANAATTEAITLTDTLGDGLTLTGALPAGCSATGQEVVCVLAAGAAVGPHTFDYSATVDADATGTVGNVVVPTTPPGGDPDPDCTTGCETEHPLTPATAVAKTSNPATGTAVSPGDTIAYTLTLTVANAATTEAITLTDTLGAGLTFGTVTSAGAFSCTGSLSCTLPAGTAPGTYAVSYTATVDADASDSVGNNVVPSTPPGGDPDPDCTAGCETEHPLTPTTSVAKASNPSTGTAVSAGDTIAYTVTVTVANAPTTEAITLTDTLGDGLTLVAGSLPAGCSATGQEVVCVLAAGAAVGPHTFAYSATVDADATGSVGNVVVPSTPPGGDPDPDCTAGCETEHPLTPATTVTKTSNPATGTAVGAGDTIAYTLTLTVANAATTEAITLTDTLGAGLTFGTVTSAGAFSCSGSLTCTLPAGAAPGTYAVSYTATVDADATGSVGNNVVPSTPPGGDPDPDCTNCETEHPLTPTTAVAKTSNPASGTAVSAGETIAYTLTVTVANAPTTEAITLTDTLGDGLTLTGALPAGCSANGQDVVCVLAAGATVGPHTFDYSATVDADATGSVGNVVVPTTPPGGDPDPDCTAGCETEHPLTPATTVAKTSNPASGAAVAAGQTIAYTLTVTVANAPTTEAITLTDTLGDGLTLAGALPAGCSANGQEVVCVLAAGAAVGPHTFDYSATVDADATGTVGNVVVPTTPPGGDPDPDCTSCETEHPLTPATAVTKTSNPATGTAVSPGDTIAYTLTVTVVNAATTEAITLTDTLGDGLTLVAGSLPAGCSTNGQDVVCVLAAGATVGSHAFAYSATVDADATGSVGNVVVPTTPPGGDPDPDCTAGCETEHPLTPATTVAKTSNPATGATVSPGDTIAYTLTVTVANAPTTEAITLTDTLGDGLTLVTGSLPAGCSANGQEVVCVLAAGAAVGPHAFAYSATVDADATGTLGNVVVPTTPPGGDPDPDCTTGCSTEHIVEPTSVTVVKSSDPAPGSEVAPGDTLTYTLTVTVANSATTEAVTLVDALGEGLTFGEVTSAGVFACTGSLTCTLPAGTVPGAYAVSYTATVDADATGTLRNAVTASNPPGGPDPDPECTTCTTEHEVVPPTITVVKSADPAPGSEVAPGDTLTYTLTVTIGRSATTEVVTLVDTLGEGLTFGEVTSAGAFSCSGSLTCTLPAGTVPGAYAVSYTATVDADATGTLRNAVTASNPPGGDPDPECTTCSTEHEVVPPAITVVKSADPAPGSEVAPGDTLTYTLTVTVANSATTEVVTLVDTLGEGLTFGAVTSAGAFACTGELTCTLPAGTVPGAYAVSYTATVDADATGTLRNAVTASNPPGGDPDPDCTTACSTEHEVVPPTITVVKSADPAPGSEVSPGDTLTYTLTVTIGRSATTEAVTLVDTLGEGLTFGAVTSAGAFACTGTLTCTLPAGTVPGAYAVSYTATVDADATGTLRNAVTASNPPGGDPDPECTTCTTEHEVIAPEITVVKSSNPASGSQVRAGDTIGYTLTVTIEHSATLDTFTLTDTLGEGLTFGAVTSAGAFACTGTLTCTLPAGTAPGTYAVNYTATVDADAPRVVRNVVTATGGTGTDGEPPACDTCGTEHDLVQPRVVVAKSAAPDDGQEVRIGDLIEYTVTVTIENSATSSELRLVDTPGPGLAVEALPAGCAAEGATVVCLLQAGTVPGTYTFVYSARVTTEASQTVRNVVLGEYTGGGDGDPPPECTVCETSHELSEELPLRITKAVGARNVAIGDLVRYTLTVQNLSAMDITDAIVVDTPPPGFSYVEGSMAVADRDGAFTLNGRHPLRIGGLDIDAGGEATIAYLLRVGAGVRPGVHVNEAVAVDEAGNPISNRATAQVTLDSDPLLDDSLIFGTVFDDRDGDGWQDRADLGEVRVQGGFAPGAYVAGSTTIDRGDGPQPLADASAPLLHGIDVGAIAARQSQGDPVEAHRVTVRQRLTATDFTGDFALTSAQGVTVRMDAAGNTTVERSGEAAKGLTAAEPTVERTVSAVEGGFEVAYVISNAGIDERGIPGVRIASVEGLLIETDQYGRYHLADVHGGDWGRGRNFILKVDPATLPPGTVFTTENPRVRRVTPGIPVRFDFGVKLPVQVLEGGERKLELELGEVIFAPGSAEVREAYLPAIQQMAGRVDEYRGGEVVIVADGTSEGLAFARAAAVRDALQARVGPEAQAGLSVVLRTEVNDPHSLVAGVDAGGALLGTVLFDTDKSNIRPEFEALLDAVAKRLDALGGGVIAIVGHTDVRASHAYNTALGLRRATAVQQALSKRLSPEVRARVRVEASSDPAAPVGTERK